MTDADRASDIFGIGTFDAGAGVFPAVVVGDEAADLRPLLPHVARTGDLLAEWDTNLDAIAAAIDGGDEAGERLLEWRSIRDLHALPPMQPVGPILAAGANYREHILQMSVAHRLGREDATEQELWDEAAIENDQRRRSGDPYIWTGLPSAVCGAFDDVQLPDYGDDLDWEVELGVVIGRSCHRIAADEVHEVVAGYTIVNDLTARTLVPRPDMALIGTDWFRAKNQPTFFPTGPVIVPARFVPDPTALRIRLLLNGEVKQDSLTDDLLFDIPSLIAYASSVARLQPGDLLITGSPAGNGSHWGRFLQEGDVMEATITGLGTQRNRVLAARGEQPPWQASRA
ncbi:fumarylacetoacetate hydrolase family protein [Gulosibacter macacae]|uniref:Fumarylacetoacetate hydrolase family protein n=1 Tax=Gulosibacter macacae TaxID=2488791 RepID=A0A3P3VTU6_9MICO|nr:fumarylacetoacetate hydrolase family protein [Gulosibacter macacae]RRJ85737.1 fumarylacetoacetate hydrolase family protein [Gulosibacter macacae]